MNNWLTAFLFFLPAGLANMAPIIANKIPVLNRWKTPLDFGTKYKGQRLLGNNKTVRGLIVGTLFAAIAGWLIVGNYALSYATNTYVLGATLMGLGALIGDATESFFKRQRGIQPGKSWFPFDQTDYIIGGLLFSYPLLAPSLGVITRVFVLYFGLHLLMSYVGFLFGFKDQPI